MLLSCCCHLCHQAQTDGEFSLLLVPVHTHTHLSGSGPHTYTHTHTCDSFASQCCTGLPGGRTDRRTGFLSPPPPPGQKNYFCTRHIPIIVKQQPAKRQPRLLSFRCEPLPDDGLGEKLERKQKLQSLKKKKLLRRRGGRYDPTS